LGKKIQLQSYLAYWGYDRSYARSLVIVLAGNLFMRYCEVT